MWYIYISLCLGILIGVTNILPEKIVKHNDKFIIISILLLLFVMGLSIGLNKEIIRDFGLIGVTGIIYAVMCVLFSILVVYLLTSIKKRGDKK